MERDDPPVSSYLEGAKDPELQRRLDRRSLRVSRRYHGFQIQEIFREVSAGPLRIGHMHRPANGTAVMPQRLRHGMYDGAD